MNQKKLKILGIYDKNCYGSSLNGLTKSKKLKNDYEVDITIISKEIDISSLQNIKDNYDAVMLGLFVTHSEVIPKENFHLDIENPHGIGRQVCKILIENNIKVLIFDSTRTAGQYALENNIPFLRMPMSSIENLGKWIRKNVE